jgi:hypothetical protein
LLALLQPSGTPIKNNLPRAAQADEHFAVRSRCDKTQRALSNLVSSIRDPGTSSRKGLR